MYITFKSKFKEVKEISFEQLFDNFFSYTSSNTEQKPIQSPKFFNTVTRFQPTITEEQMQTLYKNYNLNEMKTRLFQMNNVIINSNFNLNNMSRYYDTFSIPKHSGGVRRIDAPHPELKELLNQVKDLFEKTLKILPHNSAYAYVPGRSTLDALQIHQKNESKWFLKLDIKNFFNNSNPEFIFNQLSKIFPLTLLLEDPEVGLTLDNIIKIATMNNGLPQGTPLSPTLTNILMVPVDYQLQNELRNFNKQHFKYTRYADDIIISSKYHFNWNRVKELVNNILKETPYCINPEKTRYGSSAGRNWNLGLMLNKDNNITIGHKRKERFKATLHNYQIHNSQWSLQDIQTLLGTIAYYEKVEPQWVNTLIAKHNQKHNTDIKMNLINQTK